MFPQTKTVWNKYCVVYQRSKFLKDHGINSEKLTISQGIKTNSRLHQNYEQAVSLAPLYRSLK